MSSLAGQSKGNNCSVCSDESRPYKDLRLEEEYGIVCERCRFLSTVVRKSIEYRVSLPNGIQQVIRWYEKSEPDPIEDAMIKKKRWSDFKLGETPNTRFELFTLPGLYLSVPDHGQDLTFYQACPSHFQTSL